LETLFVLAFALVGLRLGLRPIGDNSTFVHLRTGMDMVRGAGIPRVDPYSFTAAGHAWVVQSWLVSYVYGWLQRSVGLEAVVLFHGVLYALLAGLLATLARTGGSARRTCLAAAIAVGVGVATWSPRPLAVGLVAFALTVLVVERRASAWWLLPIGWVWVNSHGSFVLGGLWLALVVVGGRRDAARYLPWWMAGVVVGAVNPLGPRLLAFPLTLVSKASNFGRVVEWRAPSFRGPLGVVALLSLAGVVAVLASGRRVPWSDLLPAVVFVAMALASQRNLAPLGVVLAPVLGRALAVGSDRDRAVDDDRPPLHTAIAAVLAAAALVFAAVTMGGDPLDFDGYPVQAAAHVARGARVASTDVGGCYLILQRGRRAHVFVDDRFDLYPTPVVKDYLALHDGRPSALRVLDRHRVDAVLWPADAPLTSILTEAGGTWRRTYGDHGWVVFERR
jgi:hypothetical protein